MAFDSKDNFYKYTVLTPPSPADSGTTLVPSLPLGNWPPPPFNLVVFPAGEEPTWENAEIVRVTGGTGSAFDIVREQEFTSARAIQAGDIIMLAPTAKTFTDLEDELENHSGPVQTVVGEYTTYGGYSSVIIPADNSIPQSSEGMETVTATITPRKATNYLDIEFTGFVSSSSSLLATVALFRDSETDAIAVIGDTISTTQTRAFKLSVRVPCGSTSAQTFKIRVGLANTGSIYINGNSGGRLYGGLAAHRLKISESK